MALLRAGVVLLVFGFAAGNSSALEPAPQRPDPAGTVDWTESPIKPEISGYVRKPGGMQNSSPILVKLETPTGSLLAQTWTGKLGDFSFPEIACGNYVLALDVPGYRSLRYPVEHSYIPLGALFLNLVPANEPGSTNSDSALAMRRSAIPKVALKEYEKGLEALGRNDPAGGVGHFRKAVEMYADYDDAYLQLGWAFIQQRSFSEAQKALALALRLEPKSAPAYALLGRIQKEQNRFLEAAKYYDRSISLEEASWRTQLEFGEVLRKLGKLDQAHAHIVRAHELAPSQPSTHLQLYNSLILRGDYAAAQAELDEFLKLFPKHPLAPRVRQQRDALQTKPQRASK